MNVLKAAVITEQISLIENLAVFPGILSMYTD